MVELGMSADDHLDRSDDEPSSSGRWLLISDVDGTLTGDTEALDGLLVAVDGRMAVVLNSSRPVASVRRSVADFGGEWLPDGIIGALGTEIELMGEAVVEWGMRFGSWVRDPVDSVMHRLGFPAHEPEYQTLRKASFSVPRSSRAQARRALTEAGVEAAIFESGEDAFDVLPPGAGKAPASRFVADRLGVPPHRVITAGDALIDAELLQVGRGIAVGNASEELLEAIDGKSVYRATAPHAAGVLEGLRHHGAPIDEDVGRR